jgi:hypothetical protein
MAQFDDFFNQDTAKGLAIGIGAAVLAPVAVSVLSGFGRPMARAAIKSGIIVYERGRETMAEVGEVFDDLVAEARYELEQGSTEHGGLGDEEQGPFDGADRGGSPPERE